MSDQKPIPTYQVTLEIPRDVYNFIDSTINLGPSDYPNTKYILQELLLAGIKTRYDPKIVKDNSFLKDLYSNIQKQINLFIADMLSSISED